MAEAKFNTQILIADNIIFDKKTNMHSIERIRNCVEVKTFPSAIVKDIFIKLSNIDDKEHVIGIKIEDDDRSVLFFFNHSDLKNMRETKMISGIDMSAKIRFVVKHEGNYFIEIYVDNVKKQSYPLYVKLTS